MGRETRVRINVRVRVKVSVRDRVRGYGVRVRGGALVEGSPVLLRKGKTDVPFASSTTDTRQDKGVTKKGQTKDKGPRQR